MGRYKKAQGQIGFRSKINLMRRDFNAYAWNENLLSSGDVMQYRSGETNSKAWYRSDRFFCMNGQWFFTTREHIDMGPFMSRKEAEIELAVFIRHVTDKSGLHLSQYDQSFFTGLKVNRGS